MGRALYKCIAAVVGLLLLSTTPAGGFLAGSSTIASASSPGPFGCSAPTDFLSVVDNATTSTTTLYSSPETPSPSWHALGTAGVPYNALGLNPHDSYLYALGIYNDHLLKVDNTGASTDRGPVTGLPSSAGEYVSGAFDPAGNLWLLGQNQAQAQEVDVASTPPAVTRMVTLSPTLQVTDWSWDFNFLWGAAFGALYRVDTTTGNVVSFSVPGITSGYNAAWTYANGDLGFLDSGSDVALRVSGVTTALGSGAPNLHTTSANESAQVPYSGIADGASCAPPLQIGTMPGGAYGAAYSQPLPISGGTPPYTAGISQGSLPPGLSLSNNIVTGTPTAAGSFTFTVTASDSSGFTDFGTGPITLTVDQAPLTITASSPPAVTYGDAAPAVTPSYSGFVGSDTTASLTSAAACTTAYQPGVPGSSGAGTYSSSCSAASDPNYTISYVNGSVVVNPRGLIVTAPSASIHYGDPAPALTPSYSGFLAGDGSAANDQAGCTTTYVQGQNAGSYPTTCSGVSDANYSPAYVAGTITVAADNVTVTASNGTSTYGSPVVAITPTYSGFLNGQAAPATAPSCGTTAASTLPAGAYATSCSGAADPNYTFTYVGGTYSITPAPLTITASPGTSTYGSAVQATTPSYSGFVNGDTPASLSGTIACTTTATPLSPVGTTDTTSCSGVSDPNYTITEVPGSYTVTPAPLSVTASSGTFPYGGNPPSITAAFSGFVNGEDATSLPTTPACSTGATTSSPVGTYASVCGPSGPDGNYTITVTDGAVTVTPVSLVITASSGSTTYGGAIPPVTPSYAGFTNGDGPAALAPAPACSTTAAAGSPVGTYTTSCSGALDPNYTITYVGGKMAIGTQTLVITAASLTNTYGTDPAAVTPTYSGFVNGDSPSSLSPGPACTSAVSASSPVGTYDTRCAGAADPNYSITYVAGTDTVTPAALTITASSGSMTYGTTPPPITPAYTGFVNTDTAASLSKAPVCTTAATAASASGTYGTSCSGAVDANYSITYAPGTMTVSVVGGPGCRTDPNYGKGPKLAGANLQGKNLKGANLAGANLQGANLQGANLQGANLEGANLVNASLKGANLQGANINGANLYGANVAGANLQGANGTTGTPGCVNLVGANLNGANLQGDNLPGSNLTGANLTGANLQDDNLTGATLTNVLGQGANFHGVNFTGATLAGANLAGANTTMATWSSTICPDGSKSNANGGTCAGHGA